MDSRNLIGINCTFLILVILGTTVAFQTQKPCRLGKAALGYVCVCDENYCDNLDVEMPKDEEFVLVTSSSAGDRFSYDIGNLYDQKNRMGSGRQNTVLKIDASKRFQRVQGWGGSITGATIDLVERITPNMRECLYKSYYSPDVGIGYNIIRTPIGGCDFDLEPWSYNEYPENDTQLLNFTKLDNRELAKNRQIKNLFRITNNKDIKIIAAAWSPPLWMKENHQWTGLANNQLKREYYQTWAELHVKWLQLMHEDEVDIWAVSTGNEPKYSLDNDVFEAMGWNASNQAIWIAEYFGPTIKNSTFSNIEIHGYDDNRINIIEYFDQMRNGNEKAFDYLTAIDLHGYSDLRSDGAILDEMQRQFPEKSIWTTEMCFGIEFMDNRPGPQLGYWKRAEDQMKVLMDDFNHSTVGYIDWNIILNSTGGPNYAAGTTDAPIILSEDFSEMYKQPLFYIMAHFAKFILPGSVRIDVKVSGNKNSDISSLAFLLPDGNQVVAVLYNNASESLDLTVEDNRIGAFNIHLQPKSINTLIYNPIIQPMQRTLNFWFNSLFNY